MTQPNDSLSHSYKSFRIVPFQPELARPLYFSVAQSLYINCSMGMAMTMKEHDLSNP